MIVRKRRGTRTALQAPALGIFIDAEYVTDGRHVTTGEVTGPFLLFALQVGRDARSVTLLGRDGGDRPLPVTLPGAPDLVLVPGYPSLAEVGRVAATLPRALAATWTWVGRVDVLWVFGPHPLALVAIVVGLLRRRRVVLGVRQDTMAYFRSRLPSRSWTPVLAPLWLMDRSFRLAGRRVPVTAVGTALAKQYGHPRAGVLPMTVALTARDDLAPAPRPRTTDQTFRILTVGRLAPEKNPLVLVEALRRVHAWGSCRWAATWVGSGPLAEQVEEAALSAGLGDALALAGYVPFGPDLIDWYRHAHLVVHTALTEGVPQVLVEAMAAGCAIVATDVGGVGDLVVDGRTGLLVPPDDPDALARAIVRLLQDEGLRMRLASAALEQARRTTREAEGARVARFVMGAPR